MPTDDIPDLCEHPYEEMVWRISCHQDITSETCRNSSQRSAMCCNRPRCLQVVSHWVNGAGYGVHRVASAARAMAGAR